MLNNSRKNIKSTDSKCVNLKYSVNLDKAFCITISIIGLVFMMPMFTSEIGKAFSKLDLMKNSKMLEL